MSESEIIFWKDRSKNRIDPKLYSDRAEDFVKEMQKDHMNSKNSNNKMNGKSQIRKFYDEVQRLHTESRRLSPEKKEDWEAILPMVNMLVAKAAYAKGRNLVSENFLNFIRKSVEQVHDPKDLAVFANFFEAVMGFYPMYIKAS